MKWNRSSPKMLVALVPFMVAATVVPHPTGLDLVIPKGRVHGTADAIASAGEYPNPPGPTALGWGNFRIQAYRSPAGTTEEIQFYFEFSDASSSSGDLVRVYLDLNHDHNVDAADREIQIRRAPLIAGGPLLLIGGANVVGEPSAPTTPASVELTVDPGGSIWKAEIKLEPSELGVNEIPSVFGLYVVALDGLTTATYPTVAPTVMDWANVGTRYPIDYVIVLDQSGSMLDQNKWINAKRAANVFANAMSILTDPAFFDDRLGLVLFSWQCAPGGIDQTSVAKPLASIGAFPAGNYVGAISDPLPDFCTPIGSGVATGFTRLEAPAVKPKQRGVLLLSDGLQNRPGYSFTPVETGYDPCPSQADWNACSLDILSNVSVSTVAFGQGDWEVDTDLLAGIQTRYPGGFLTTFSLLSNFDELTQAFLTGLEDLYITNQIAVTAWNLPFSVTSGDRRMIALMSWTTPTDAQQIALQLGGVTIPCDQKATNTIVGFSICVKNDPNAGEWTAIKDGGGGFPTSPSHLFVVVDLRVRAHFDVSPRVPATGGPLLITAELRDRGQPVLHDASHPVDVRVQIETPNASLGTFVVVHEPKTCRVRDPQLPAIDPELMRAGARAPVAAAAATGTGDPDPPLFAAAASLLADCNENGLGRTVSGGLVLRDDGSQGDATANDGIYSLRFDDTNVAGTYVFTFRVTGTAADGEHFARTGRFAKYVRVAVTPEATVADSRIVQQVANTVVSENYILPRDNDGEYLGPGKADKVDFVLDHGPGTFLGGVIDYGNGYYARRIQYDRTQGTPVVTPVVYGQRLEQRKRPFEFGVFAGMTLFENALGLKDGPVVGARLGYHFASHFVIETEAAVTFADATAGGSGQVIQILGSVRYQFGPGPRVNPFLTVAGGKVFARGFGTNDDASVIASGLGVNLWLRPSFGVRADARVLRIEAILGAPATTNYQATAGFVLRF